MRRSYAIAFPAIVALLLAAQLLSWGDALEYRRALAFSEPWRLLTAHFVHLTLLHAMLNGVALLLLGRLFGERLRPAEFFAILLLSPVAISVLVWILLPALHWYRGLSDVLHAIYFAGCVAWIGAAQGRARWLPVAALVLGTAKVLVEQPWNASFPVHEVLRIAVVPQAHLVGALVGTAAGLVLRLRGRGAPARDAA
jgi:rhomboid family GlyGly-CTERM serine protease